LSKLKFDQVIYPLMIVVKLSWWSIEWRSTCKRFSSA